MLLTIQKNLDLVQVKDREESKYSLFLIYVILYMIGDFNE